MTRILLIEDNHNLARMVQHNLQLEGYEVESVGDGTTALRRAMGGTADLLVLDLMIPQPDGFEVLRALRAAGVLTPVIVLSSLGEETSKLRGFRLGADDYVTKPFSVLELAARVEAVLRRGRSEPGKEEPREIRFGEVRIDPPGHRVERRGRPVELRPKEFQLLMALVRRPGRLCSRTELLEEVWGYASDVVSRTVDTHIGELRRKLEVDPSEPRHLVTVRKAGFRFEP